MRNFIATVATTFTVLSGLPASTLANDHDAISEQIRSMSKQYYDFYRSNPSDKERVNFVIKINKIAQKNPQNPGAIQLLNHALNTVNQLPEDPDYNDLKVTTYKNSYQILKEDTDRLLLTSTLRFMNSMSPMDIEFCEKIISSDLDEYTRSNAALILASAYLRSSHFADTPPVVYRTYQKRAEELLTLIASDYSDITEWQPEWKKTVRKGAHKGKPVPPGVLGEIANRKLNGLRTINVGNKAPDLAAKTITGNEDSLKKYRGKVVLMDFWATWCGPCKAGMPKLLDFKNKLNTTYFEIISLSVDEDVEDVISYQDEEQPMPWVNWHIGRDDTLTDWNITAFPTYILLDKQGKITLKTNYFTDQVKRSVVQLLENNS